MRGGFSHFEAIQCFMPPLRDPTADRRDEMQTSLVQRGHFSRRYWTTMDGKPATAPPTLSRHDGGRGEIAPGIPASNKTMSQICHLNEIVSFT